MLKLTQTQRTAKVRLYSWLEDNKATHDIDSLTIDRMSELSKTKSLATWLLDEEFSSWWYDRDTVTTKVAAYQEIAVNRLVEILHWPMEGGRDAIVTSKDVMNAAKTILELGGAFPKGNKEVIFADRKINGMNDDQVQKELDEYKQKLSLASGVPIEKKV